MAQDRLTHREELAAFYLEQCRDKGRGVYRVGLLVANDQTKALALLKVGQHRRQIFLQCVKGDTFFVEVDAFGTACQATEQCQVAAVAAHHFNYKAAPGGYRRMLDLVNDFPNAVERGIGTDTEFSTWQVVIDCGGQADDWDVEGGEVFALAVQSVRCLVARPAANHQ